jgi:hypothetical protein
MEAVNLKKKIQTKQTLRLPISFGLQFFSSMPPCTSYSAKSIQTSDPFSFGPNDLWCSWSLVSSSQQDELDNFIIGLPALLLRY